MTENVFVFTFIVKPRGILEPNAFFSSGKFFQHQSCREEDGEEERHGGRRRINIDIISLQEGRIHYLETPSRH